MPIDSPFQAVIKPQTSIIPTGLENAFPESFFSCVLVLGDNPGSEAQMANENGVCGSTKARAAPCCAQVLLQLVGRS